MQRSALLLLVLAAIGAAACRSDLLVGSESADAAFDAAHDTAADTADANPALAQGLVAYWKLDDRFGTAAFVDSSGLGNGAEPQSLSASDWRTGHFGGGLEFGRAGWVRVFPTASLNAIATTVSISLWMNLTGTFPDEQIVLARQKGTGPEVDFALRLRDGHLGFGGATLAPCESPTPVPLGGWVAVAATYDGQWSRIYMDGREAMSCAVTGAFPTDGRRISIGARYASEGEFDADERLGPAVLDEVALYDRGLTAGEVGALASGQTPR
jgi:hypothetical protein